MIKDKKIREWFFNNKDQEGKDIAKILGAEYAHIKLGNEDDLFITKYGIPFIENLRPENYWTDKEWYKENSTRLSGTSCLYKVRTKKVNGKHKDIVLKWNRMGQDIPGAEDSDKLMNADFNSPFEEFSLVMELRNAVINSSTRIVLQKPLAIYVPSESIELWRMGRKEYKMQLKIKAHKEVALDMFRSYAVIYEWIEGIDAAHANDKGILEEECMKSLTLDSMKKLMKKGFLVRDSKPSHVIVKPKDDSNLERYKDGKILYGLVDFELLERTPEREEMIKREKRIDYLRRQKERFAIEIPQTFHPHLSHVNIFGVDYVYGHVESTKGRLWVVGKDPYLFDYFLPERWEKTLRTKISLHSEMYYTVTKDNIHLVWKLSNVGLLPNMDPFKEDERNILGYGHNSPFEEVATAMELNFKGIPTTYPRAIYMTGNNTDISENLFDNSRYESHRDILTPDGFPILMRNHDYIIIWGYWNGPDEKLASKDGDYYEGIDAIRAYWEGIITREQYLDLLQTAKEKLMQAGIEDLNLRGNHLLVSLDNQGNLITDDHGITEIRVCNFEFLKKL